MAQKMMVLSDLTNGLVPDGEAVTVIVRSHPMLEEPVMLDAAASEVKPVLQDGNEYVVLEVLKDGTSKQAVVELTEFNALFRDDPYAVLQGARRVKTTSPTKGARRSKEELDEIRTWAKANGWPDIKDRGRIPAEVEDAYNAANPAA